MSERVCTVCELPEDYVYMIGGAPAGKCTRRMTPDWSEGVMNCYRRGYHILLRKCGYLPNQADAQRSGT